MALNCLNNLSCAENIVFEDILFTKKKENDLFDCFETILKKGNALMSN
jgi:hypothetical protein